MVKRCLKRWVVKRLAPIRFWDTLVMFGIL